MGISFAFQQPVKFKGLTVRDILSLALKKESDKHNLCRILSTVGLCGGEYLQRPLDDLLSGGELKRIEIATILAKETKLAIFDEPEAGIDLWSFNNLIDVFENICKQKYLNMIVISHQEKILSIADSIILMKNGKIVNMGKKSEVMKDLNFDNSCPVIGGYKNE
jgi:Fe-S cluster assembly ATP-binding protein